MTSSKRIVSSQLSGINCLTLTALVEQEDARYVAWIEGPMSLLEGVRGEGESPDSAREDLVQAMLSWISSQDCAENMADALAAAGFPQIDDDTELLLEFSSE